MDLDQIIEIERIGVEEERRVVETIAATEPSWRSMTFTVADGWALLSGAGLFVNQCMAAGLTEPLTSNDLEHVAQHAAEVGVPAAFELCDATRSDVVALLEAEGWQRDGQRLVLLHPLEALPAPIPGVDIALVSESELAIWQATSAAGWGHTEPRAVAANNTMAAAAFVADDPGLLLARDPADGRPLGCAALRISEGIATLGGMSTRPDERRRGVQSGLIEWRLRAAVDRGCRYAVSMTQPGSDSERNLRRAGFTPAYTKTNWVKP